jgi:hypothetical protein
MSCNPLMMRPYLTELLISTVSLFEVLANGVQGATLLL